MARSSNTGQSGILLAAAEYYYAIWIDVGNLEGPDFLYSNAAVFQTQDIRPEFQ